MLVQLDSLEGTVCLLDMVYVGYHADNRSEEQGRVLRELHMYTGTIDIRHSASPVFQPTTPKTTSACEQVMDIHRPQPSTFLFLTEEELKKEFVDHPFPPPALR